MEHPSRQVTLITCIVALFLLLFVSGVFAQENDISSDLTQALFEYSHDVDTVVVEFHQKIGRIANSDSTPRLRIYGDGRVHVHYPAYMKKAGDYRLHLSDQEMRKLISSLVEKKLMHFDAKATNSLKRETDKARRQTVEAQGKEPILVESSNESTTIIRISLNSYKPAGVAIPVLKNVMKEIAWYGLQWDAQQYPEIEVLKNLEAAEKELMTLTKHKDLQKERQ